MDVDSLLTLCPGEAHAPTRLALARALADGADPNTRDENGDTAAHFVARAAVSAEAARALLSALSARGAELSALNRTGKTPLDVAVHDEVRQVLLAQGGKSARQAVKPTPVNRKPR